MTMVWKILFIILNLVHFFVCQSKELVFTHVIYRHGDRSPGGTFPTDPYQEDYWPQGWSQLTNLGMQQQYELGQYLRNRYRNFLSKSYKRDEVYVRSTDKDRTLQSAQCNLAGLFPAEGIQQWSNVIPSWQPIPIHTIPEDDDFLLNMDASCPAYDKDFERYTVPRIKKYNEDYKDFFEYLKQKTGLTELDLTSVGDVYGPLFREKAQGLPLPQWSYEIYDKTANKTVYDITVEFKTISKLILFDSPSKAKYRAGFLLGEMIQRMKDKTKAKKNKPAKMMMYSAHDDTVLALMCAMNVSNNFVVPYAGCLMMELYKTDNRDFWVEIYFRNVTDREPHRLTAPGCRSFSCPLSEFELAVQNNAVYSTEERNTLCGIVPACLRDEKISQTNGINSSTSAAIAKSMLLIVIPLLYSVL